MRSILVPGFDSDSGGASGSGHRAESGGPRRALLHPRRFEPPLLRGTSAFDPWVTLLWGWLGHELFRGFSARSPSSALLPILCGEGSQTKIDNRESW